MRYDIKLSITYDYPAGADAGRHVLCLVPVTLTGEQTVLSSCLTVEPDPAEWLERVDFFGNAVVEVAFDAALASTAFTVAARVERFAAVPSLDISPPLAALEREIGAWRGLDGQAPHHFLAASPRVPRHDAMTDYARAAAMRAGAETCFEVVEAVGLALHRDMRFDAEATTVDTPALEAFEARHGVCQDFSHIMIACLRGLGIPAGYVSGFLRTKPPAGQARLEGADAMHAWVRAWCGFEMGWVEYDPTNAMFAGLDHVVIARGRDYADVAPVRGVLRLAGGQDTTQAVDVIALD